MAARSIIFSVVLTLIHGLAAADVVRGASPFVNTWRREVYARVARIAPFHRKRGPAVERPYMTQVAKIIGTSEPFASMALRQADRHLSLDHASRLAEAGQVSADYVLAADLLDRFATLEELEREVAGERTGLRDLLLTLYRKRRGLLPPAAPPSLADAWRSAVNARLAQVYPVETSSPRKNKYGVKLDHMADDLSERKIVVGEIVNGPRVLSRTAAARIAERHKVSARWLLAVDVLEAAGDRAALKGALVGASPDLIAYLLDLNDESGCTSDLN